MNFGSLFTGIGGIDLGFERAGMKCAWQVEIDDYCTRVLEKHWPNVERFKDVRAVGKHNLSPVDLITGGFPCQPHSVAGKRRGKEDDRNLWPAYLRIIQELKPRWVVGENVPGIITTMLDDVLADLEGAGYAPLTFNIPAAAFGANHRRYRIFVVAYASQQYGAIHGQKAPEFGWGSKIVANTDSIKGSLSGEQREDQTKAGIGSKNMADTECNRLQEPKKNKQQNVLLQTERSGLRCGNEAGFSNAQSPGLERPDAERSIGSRGRPVQFSGCDWWSVEPDVGRVADGVPHRVDRLRALGNAVVPQVAEFIGRSIMEAEAIFEKEDSHKER